MRKFQSGLFVVHNESFSDDSIVLRITEHVNNIYSGKHVEVGISAYDIAKIDDISIMLALEQLLVCTLIFKSTYFSNIIYD